MFRRSTLERFSEVPASILSEVLATISEVWHVVPSCSLLVQPVRAKPFVLLEVQSHNYKESPAHASHTLMA